MSYPKEEIDKLGKKVAEALGEQLLDYSDHQTDIWNNKKNP